MFEPTAQSPIVFLSGAGLPSWIWDEVRGRLDVESVVAEYPRRADATLRDYAEAVLSQVGWPRFTIVAHSIGGVVAAEVVALAPERVDGVLGVAASVPSVGTSFLGALPFPQGAVVGLVMRVAGTQPPDKAIRGLCGGVAEEEAARIVADFAPESQRLYRDPVSERELPARRGYVVTGNDTQFPPALQEKYAAELGGGWRRDLATAHLPMLEDAAGMAAAIDEFAAVSRP